MPVPFTFATATSAIPLSQLDSNFATTITLGNTAIQLGNTVTTLNNMTLANVTISSGGSFTSNSISTSGNLTFTGTGNRITGDFSNATVASRVMFQNSTTNGRTNISALPNGTSTTAGVDLYGSSSDLANTSLFRIANTNAEYQLEGTRNGTGTYLPMTFYTGGSERMRIDTSGNVGIGTTSTGSGTKLEIRSANTIADARGIVAINSTNAAAANVGGSLSFGGENGQAITPFIFGSIAGRYEGSTYAGYLQFCTTSAPFGSILERMRIDSSGNLCLGTTSSVGLFTATNNSASQATAFFSNTAASSQATPSAYFRKFDNTSTTSQVFLQFQINNGAAGSGQINANGASAAAFGAFSDSRLKENITDLPSQLSNIMALRPVEFDYIESEGGGHQIGFIAQEVQEIYPDLVGERADGMFTLTDMNKNDARLIKAIQELKAELDVCKAEIAALKGAK